MKLTLESLPSLAAALRGLIGGLALCAAAQAQVGLATLVVGDMPVTLVYPTAQVARPVAFGPFELMVAPDAPPLPGVRRLVVLSHGTGGSTTADHDLAATLALAGFLVAQPLHPGDNYRDASRAGPAAWATRPQEVTRVIDALAQHAQWRVLDLVRHCAAQADADAGFCFNGLPDAAARAARKAQFERSQGVPEAYFPADVTAVHGGRSPAAAGDELRPDPRVAAVTVAVPVAAIFSSASLGRLRVPVGVVAASQDTMLMPAFHSARLLRDCPSCTLLADLRGAAHMDLVAPWPASVASSTAARQYLGALPAPGFETRLRDAAFVNIAAFYQRELAR